MKIYYSFLIFDCELRELVIYAIIALALVFLVSPEYCLIHSTTETKAAHKLFFLVIIISYDKKATNLRQSEFAVRVGVGQKDEGSLLRICEVYQRN